MKKTSLLIIMLVAVFYLQAQTIVSTAPANRNAILEEFTGIHCTWCPAGHKVSNDIKAANPGTFFPINIHTGTYANSTPSEPNFRTPDGDSIAKFSGASIIGYPSGSTARHLYDTTKAQDGNVHLASMSRNMWQQWAQQVIATPSYVNVAATASIDLVTRQLTVYVESYFTGTTAPSKMQMNVALLQNNVLGPQAGMEKNPAQIVGTKYDHVHILRDLITPLYGDTISTTTQGSLFSKTYNYSVPAVIGNVPVDLLNIELVVFMTDSNNEIITANEAKLTNIKPDSVSIVDLRPTKIVATQPASMCQSTFTPIIDIANDSISDVDSFYVNITSNGAVTKQFIHQKLAGQQVTQVTLNPISIRPNLQYSLSYNVSLAGLESRYMETNKINNDIVQNPFYTMPAVPLANIYEEKFETGLTLTNIIVTGPKQTFGEVTKSSFAGDTNEVGAYAISPTSYYINLNAQDSNSVTTYLIKTLSFDTASNNAIILDYAYQQKDSASADTMQIIVSTDCGLTWTTVWQRSDSSLKTVDPSSTIFAPRAQDWRNLRVSLSAFDSQPNVIVGLRFINGGGNGLFFDNLKVLNNITSVKENSKNDLQLKLYPNPATDVLNISYIKKQPEMVTIKFMNYVGQQLLVKQFNANEGKNVATINVESYPKGIYFIQIESKEAVTTQKVIIK